MNQVCGNVSDWKSSNVKFVLDIVNFYKFRQILEAKIGQLFSILFLEKGEPIKDVHTPSVRL